jgi:3-deoxy-D-manno-octulosonic-acid transferase
VFSGRPHGPPASANPNNQPVERGPMYFLYSCLTLVVLVLLLPYFGWQAFTHKKYVVNLRQRLGYLPISFNVDAEESIWLHAVSVGEVLTARALTGELRKRYPNLRLFVSTTTIAGQQVAAREIKDAEEFARSAPWPDAGRLTEGVFE